MDLKKILERAWQLDAFQEELEQLPKIKRDFNAYFQEHFSDKEKEDYEESLYSVNRGGDIEKKVNDAYFNFMKIKEEDFDSKYLIPDETQTKTFITLTSIDYILSNFRKEYYKEDVNEFKEPENVYKKVYSLLKELDNEIAQVALSEIKETIASYNINLYLNSSLKPEKWRFMQIEFLKMLEPSIKKTPQELPKKNFEDYITIAKDTEGLKKFLSGIKGKSLAVAITYLEENGIIAENIIKKYFYNSFNPELNQSGVNKYLSKDDGNRTKLDEMADDEKFIELKQSIVDQMDTFLK
ncbi:hypothetical protein [Epilithonimonas hominis]|uniref:hypothetical protein n=1 Tax=Epilithonimonas hominis TaxID=420404 RepID=UPI0028A1AFC8|nr:hypothetical protein [Epilithonimonas hominis]